MRPARKEALALAASLLGAGACAAASFALLGGCQLKNCDASQVWYFDLNGLSPLPGVTYLPPPPERAVTLGGTTWESSPVDGTYLDFPGQRSATFGLTFPDGGAFVGTYVSVQAYVSPDPRPSENGSNFTLASGNLAEVQINQTISPNLVTVHNDTCAQYYLRVVVTREPPASAPDGGADAEAGSDAGGSGADGGGMDAGLDGATDGGH